MGVQLGTEGGEHREDLRQGIEIHTDVDRDEGRARGMVAPEHGEIGIGMQRQTGVRIPHDRGAVQLGGAVGVRGHGRRHSASGSAVERLSSAAGCVRNLHLILPVVQRRGDAMPAAYLARSG